MSDPTNKVITKPLTCGMTPCIKHPVVVIYLNGDIFGVACGEHSVDIQEQASEMIDAG